MRLRSQNQYNDAGREAIAKAQGKFLREISEKKEIKFLASKKLKDSSFFWILLAMTRFYLAIAQTGYIHPDEYFQSVHVMAYDILEIDAPKPWEFSLTKPIRSVVFSGFVSAPYFLLKYLSPFAKSLLGVELLCPKLLIIAPRIFMVTLSFICDFCVYKIASLCYVRPWQCVEVFAGSYVMLVYASRTFSNSVELILFSLLLWRISLSMVESTKIIRRENVLDELYDSSETMKEKVKIVRFKNKLMSYNYTDSFFISVIVTLGVFIRPTFLIYSFIPVAYWLQRGVVTKELSFSVFNWRCLSLLPGTVLIFFSCVCIDSFYYETLNVSTLTKGPVTLASLTVTPLNFLFYNINFKNLASHGVNPYFHHVAVNIPLLHGVLGILGLWSVSKYLALLIFRNMASKPKVYSLATMHLCSFIFPVLVLSILPHQEARFLLPTLVPLVILHSDKISIYALPKFSFKRHSFFLLWQLGNLFCVLFFGFFHQGGVVKSLEFVYDYVGSQPPSQHFHVFFSHMYSPPTFLLMRKIPVVGTTKDGRQFKVERNIVTHDLGSSLLVNEIFEKMLDVRSKNAENPPRVILCVTGSLSRHLISSTPKNYVLRKIKRFPGHFSAEHLPDFNIKETDVREGCNSSCVLKSRVTEFSVDVFLFEPTSESKEKSETRESKNKKNQNSRNEL